MKYKTWVLSVSLIALAGCATNDGELSRDEKRELALSEYDQKRNFALMAEQAQQRGDYQLAVTYYRSSLKEEDSNESSFVKLGMLLLDMGAQNEAHLTLSDSLSRFPHSPDVHCAMGAVYLAIAKPEEALLAYDKALVLQEGYGKALNGKGIAYDLLGDHDEAHKFFKMALEANPNNVSFEGNYALSLVLTGKVSEAIPVLERLAASPDATPRVRQNLALAYGLTGNTKAAKLVGLKDLNEQDVRNNIAYAAAIRKIKNKSGMVNPTRPGVL